VKRSATALVLVLVLLLPALSLGGSVTPKPGRYDPDCPQGYLSICGEGVFIVLPGGKKIEKYANVPWPNDPAQPSTGICGRDNPFVSTRIPIKNGSFSYTGTASGKSYTWKGTWVKPKKMTGTVKWDGCATKVQYTAKFVPAP
jgi:hypothetical protein